MMDGFTVEYIYPNDVSLEYAQIYLHPRTLKDLPTAQWYFVYGDNGVVDISEGSFLSALRRTAIAGNRR